MTELVEFLRARLDARELDADCIHSTGCMQIRWDGLCDCGEPEHVRREIEAKRDLLDEHHDVNDGDCAVCVDGKWGYPTHGGSSPQRHPCHTLRLLVQPYVDHADYQQEWALTSV